MTASAYVSEDCEGHVSACVNMHAVCNAYLCVSSELVLTLDTCCLMIKEREALVIPPCQSNMVQTLQTKQILSVLSICPSTLYDFLAQVLSGMS